VTASVLFVMLFVSDLTRQMHCDSAAVLSRRCFPLCCLSISWSAGLQAWREDWDSCDVNARWHLNMLSATWQELSRSYLVT